MASTTPEMLKVLSNPIRMRILGTLRLDGAQSVGSISASIGEAPGSVSYHLSIMEKNNLVHKVDSPNHDARTSWWVAAEQKTIISTNSADTNTLDTFKRSASITRHLAYERFLDHFDELSEEWKNAVTSDDCTFTLTAEQTASMAEELRDVLAKWEKISQQNAQSSEKPAASTQTDLHKVVSIIQVFRWIA
ncbi:winged helix-turn-helix domain-containing protein [Alloscardovia criceti]|uniref:winged helix-turn-helix domain-containing protein n=1 Tax=Alloscardovia criceti TaxID=356828 RepID=UPI000378C71A|nr:helix-turn-helix domain-containing protein [Alloscardovia criceti]